MTQHDKIFLMIYLNKNNLKEHEIFLMKVYDKLELNEFSGSTRKSGFKTPCYENVTISSRRVNQEKKT